MTELKTIEDLDTLHHGYVVSKRKLKKEAIKWVKNHDNIYGDINLARDMFMEFHNITEDDLE